MFLSTEGGSLRSITPKLAGHAQRGRGRGRGGVLFIFINGLLFITLSVPLLTECGAVVWMGKMFSLMSFTFCSCLARWRLRHNGDQPPPLFLHFLFLRFSWNTWMKVLNVMMWDVKSVGPLKRSWMMPGYRFHAKSKNCKIWIKLKCETAEINGE